MIKIPSYLQAGDTIGIVCPAGYMAKEKAQTCIDVLQEWGYKVKVGKTLGSGSDNYFSGTDAERLQDLQDMLDDDSVKAILCGRGGYGVGRIIDQISFRSFKKHPKWIIGFSDITVLHAHIYSNYKIATLHAPMAAAFNDEGYKGEYVQSLKYALEGKKAKYSCVPHMFNKKGEAVGELVGGNLALLVNITGTPSQLKTKGRILFIEDVGEYLYSIDRMFWQLKRSGQLDKLAGLIIGGFTDMKDTERPFGKTVEEIIHEIVQEYDYPVCFNFPVSHGKENYALKVGVGYKLKVGTNKVILEE
ncbi:MAG: LD-carboxypeptidase [Chitinophagaceae bacterium]|nr:LD-carboxypeptidase [Chitinophagaceae bacterium]